MPRRSPAARPSYSAHPLYRLRRAELINTVVGLVFSIIAIAALLDYDRYGIPPFLFAIVLQFLSFIYVLHDLITYAAQPARSPTARDHATPAPRPTDDPEPKWPSRRLVISDLVFAIAFQWLFWGLFAAILDSRPRYSYGSGAETFEAYANLTNLLASILHGIAFWKELMARKYTAWKRDLEARVCRQCAGAVEEDEQDAEHETGVVHAESEAGAGAEEASAERPGLLERLSKGKAMLPAWAGGVQDADEGRDGSVAGASVHEALLATPDESNVGAVDGLGYGTLDQSVESVSSAPETIVRKKEKGKKRLVEID